MTMVGMPQEMVQGMRNTPRWALTGGVDYPWITDVGRQVAETMPNGRHRVLEGQEHVVPPDVLMPVLVEFVTD